MEWRTLNNFSRPWGAETEPGYLVPGLRHGCGLEWDRPIRGVVEGWALGWLELFTPSRIWLALEGLHDEQGLGVKASEYSKIKDIVNTWLTGK